jgi:ABC-type sugar transport system substrate-binding protein
MKHTSRILGAGLSVSLLAVLAACGGNTETTDSSGSGGSTEPASSEIVAAGEKAATDAGGEIELEDRTVGWVYYGANGIASQRAYNGLESAGKAIGWEIVPCDGQGIPTEQQRCASSLLNQGVDALVVNTLDVATMADAIKQAEADGIPIVAIGGALDTTTGYAGNFAPDEAAMATELGGYIVETLGEDGGGVIQQTFPAKFATLRTDALEAAYEGTEVSVVDSFDADPVDLTAATQKQTSAALSANPDAKAVTMVFSTAEIGAAQALTQQFGGGKSFPDRPLLTTFYANLPVIDMIKGGQLDAAAENPIEWCGWVAIDQLAEFFARGTTISTEERPDYGDGLDFWRATVVTKDNLPDAGQLLAPPVDFAGFFKAKWGAEFGA